MIDVHDVDDLKMSCLKLGLVISQAVHQAHTEGDDDLIHWDSGMKAAWVSTGKMPMLIKTILNIKIIY